MEYIKINKSTNDIIEYPYFIGKLFEENPNISFPSTIPQSILSDYGIYEVFENSSPSYDNNTQTIYKSSPYYEDDKWKVDWLIRNLTPEELYSKVNYMEFWNCLVQNPIYITIKQQASQNLSVNVVCTEFITLISEAKLGIANPTLIQLSINELINILTLTSEEYNSIQLLMLNGNMNLVYTLPSRQFI